MIIGANIRRDLGELARLGMLVLKESTGWDRAQGWICVVMINVVGLDGGGRFCQSISDPVAVKVTIACQQALVFPS